MRSTGLETIDRLLGTLPGSRDVLDVGALDVNGAARPIVEARGWGYTGLDLAAGDNVDIVAPSPYSYPIPDGAYDTVISLYAMEHVESIWRWVPELVRVLAPGGYLAIITHHQFIEHRYPVDCWRVLPDGMRHLFVETGVMFGFDIRLLDEYDILGAAWKAHPHGST